MDTLLRILTEKGTWIAAGKVAAAMLAVLGTFALKQVFAGGNPATWTLSQADKALHAAADAAQAARQPVGRAEGRGEDDPAVSAKPRESRRQGYRSVVLEEARRAADSPRKATDRTRRTVSARGAGQPSSRLDPGKPPEDARPKGRKRPHRRGRNDGRPPIVEPPAAPDEPAPPEEPPPAPEEPPPAPEEPPPSDGGSAGEDVD